jgi:hypothetical protein
MRGALHSSRRFLLFGVVSVAVMALVVVGARPASASGPQKWILEVGPHFQAADVRKAGGTLEWHWKEAGIAVAVASDPQFGDRVLGPNVTTSVADVAAQLRSRPLAGTPRPAGAGFAFDAYASRWQWYWQAIGAVRYDDSGKPLWQLGDYRGSGVKIGVIDTGAPAVWDPPENTNWAYPGNPVGLHPELHRYDPADPGEGGVVLLEDPASGDVVNYDLWGHGTAVGSTLGARGQAEGAMRGLTPKATLYFHRIDIFNFVSSALEGWYKAAEFGCRILNNSWYDVELPVARMDEIVIKLPQIFRRAATELNRRGVLIVAAASNDAIDPQKDGATFFPWALYGFDHGLSAGTLIPQDMPHVVVVGGTGPADYDPNAPDPRVYDPSPGSANGGQKGREFNLDRSVNFSPDAGVAAGSDYGTFLTVAAPMGANIKDFSSPLQAYQLMYLATPWTADSSYPYHDFWWGTSFSTPITCGVAALAAEAYARVHGEMPSPAKLASILKQSADDLVGPATDDFWVWNGDTLQFELILDAKADKPGKDARYGHGRVNVKRAIELAAH